MPRKDHLPLFALAGVALACALAAGCVAPQSRARADVPKSTAATNAVDAPNGEGPLLSREELDKKVEALARFAAGISRDLNESPDEAFEQFFLAAEADPGNEGLVLDISRQLLRKKQPARAAEILSRTAALPNATGMVDSLLGIAYAQLGKTNEAISACRAAIKKMPHSILGYQSLTQVYLQARRMVDALQVLDDAAKVPVVDAPFLVELSGLYLACLSGETGDKTRIREKLVSVLDAAAKLNPLAPELLRRMADAYALADQAKRAAEIYQGLVQRFPGELELREKLFRIYVQGNDLKSATAQMEEIVRANPGNGQAYYVLGTLAANQKDFTNAVSYFEKAIQFRPDNETAYHELAMSLLMTDNAQKAIEVLTRANVRFKMNFVAEYYTGLAHSRLKDYAKAVFHLTAAEQIARQEEPDRLTPQFYYQLGIAQERNKNFEDAEKYFDQCIDAAPKYAEALNYLGYTLADRGVKLGRARDLIERAVKIEPENPAFLDSLGWVLFRLGKSSEALPWIEKAIHMTKEPDATLLDHLGDIHAALNQMDKAREAWRKSISVEANPEIQKKLEGAGRPSSK